MPTEPLCLDSTPTLPKVSCIMPTMPGREAFRVQAIKCFDSQTYQNRELVIVQDPGTVGAKRNLACSRAKGEIICHWDDDDYSAPRRVEDQVKRLLASDSQITGYHSMLFQDAKGIWWKYTGWEGYALGTSLCYYKDFWRKRRFEDLAVSEDNAFIRGIKVASVDAEGMMWARIHDGNTSKKTSKTLACGEWERLG